MTVIIGFAQTGSARDTESIAKDYVKKHFAAEISWYAIAQFSGGHLYEVHQGGNGISYLPQVIEKLNANIQAGVVRVPSGHRVMQVSIREGSPVPLLLSEAESRAFLGRGEEFPVPTGKMKPAVKSGLTYVYAGMTGMAVGTLMLFGSIGYYFAATSNAVLSKPISSEQLPHRQWETVRRIRADQYVNRLKFENGRWTVDFADSPPDPTRIGPIPLTPPPPAAPQTAPPQQLLQP